MSEEPKKRDLALDLFRSYKTGFSKKKKSSFIDSYNLGM